jgi:hypothetical protein
MVRPLKGDHSKSRVTISVYPEVWKAFQEACATKIFPKEDASPHLEKMMKDEVARLNGDATAAAAEQINEANLRERQVALARKDLELRQLLEKSGAQQRIRSLCIDYDAFVNPDAATVKRVLKRIVQDLGKPGTPAQKFLDGKGSQTELNLFIQLVRVAGDKTKVDAALLNLLRKHANDWPEEPPRVEAEASRAPEPTPEEEEKEEEPPSEKDEDCYQGDINDEIEVAGQTQENL